MNIQKTRTDGSVTLALSGRLDSLTQSDLAKEVETVFESPLSELIFDLSALEYISSAGLRVFYSAKKKAQDCGATMKVVKASKSVREIFQIIGFPLDD